MKKTLFICLTIILFSCKKNNTISTSQNKDSFEDKAQSIDKNSLIVDSIHVKEEVKLTSQITSSFSSHLLVFPSIKNKALLDSIYSGASIRLNDYTINNLKKELEKQKKVFFEENKINATDLPIDFEQTWSQESYMGKVSSHKDVLTLTYTITGFSGGAHGYSNTLFKNFDLKNEKVIGLPDIFTDPQKMNWNKILSSHFENPEQKEMLLVDKIMVNNNFYFSNSQITFVYNPYEITAYAAGEVFITIPFSELKSFLQQDFITQYNIK